MSALLVKFYQVSQLTGDQELPYKKTALKTKHLYAPPPEVQGTRNGPRSIDKNRVSPSPMTRGKWLTGADESSVSVLEYLTFTLGPGTRPLEFVGKIWVPSFFSTPLGMEFVHVSIVNLTWSGAMVGPSEIGRGSAPDQVDDKSTHSNV